MRLNQTGKSVKTEKDLFSQHPQNPKEDSENFTQASGVIVPPGCDHPILRDCGETVSTYTPSSYRPYSMADSTYLAPPHAMHGKTGGISVPKGNAVMAQKSMAEYLNQFQGAFLCLDFWLDSHFKVKKCGTLLEVGKDFLVLRENQNMKITLIDLKPVRFINIYCK